MMSYPPGFDDWPEERRNKFFAEQTSAYREGKSAKAKTAEPPGARGTDGEPPAPATADGADRAPAFSDEALALLFAERHAGDLRFVAKWSAWLSWTGKHWRFDDTLAAFDLVRRIIREVAARCNKTKDARIIASAKTVAAVERWPAPTAASPRRLSNGTPTRGS